ncbi:uncharacterized protein LOC106181548 [Lingula anatina]|uniref:Uncharacterized protein LOC106181548 n=1 Tax=Lingula anatina TaxID=7574 RepID=A0A1S3KFK6_LINAN|nr:uncharacterized protein LOC106181548 [Lingula anatina]|eukprot:XP_013421418.1 uncharacterized protein LOC106181548 [Lingula anatina]
MCTKHLPWCFLLAVAVFCAGSQSCDSKDKSDWSACTASCGGGLQTRRCSDTSIVARACNPQSCANSWNNIVKVPPPRGFWPLQSSTRGRDCSLHGNHAHVHGVSFHRESYDGAYSSAKFAGTAMSYLTIPNEGAKLETRSFTYVAFVRIFADDTNNAGPLFNFQIEENDAFSKYGTHISLNGSNRLFVRLMIAQPYKFLGNFALPAFSASTWVHAAVSYDYTTGLYHIYKNGVELGESYVGRYIHNTSGPVRIGARHASSGDARYFKGAMKCVQWFGEVLTAKQIQETMHACDNPVPCSY